MTKFFLWLRAQCKANYALTIARTVSSEVRSLSSQADWDRMTTATLLRCVEELKGRLEACELEMSEQAEQDSVLSDRIFEMTQELTIQRKHIRRLRAKLRVAEEDIDRLRKRREFDIVP